jgi:cation diffusion facilitator family transporter
MIALLICYEAIGRCFDPVPIAFGEAIPIACLGLAVNVASVWLLGGLHHGHDHGHAHWHGHGHGHGHDHADDDHCFNVAGTRLRLEVFETGVPPRFRLTTVGTGNLPPTATVVTDRPGQKFEAFTLTDRGGYLESAGEIAEPHAFVARVGIPGEAAEIALTFSENAHSHALHRDNNMRAAVIHVLADAAVSVMVIGGLGLAYAFGWLWMDPLASVIGAVVIASWSLSLIRDTGAVLLDMNPDRAVAESIRSAVETDGDQVADLHLWRLGPGHLGAILSVVTRKPRDPRFYRARLAGFTALSHLTVEVEQAS